MNDENTYGGFSKEEADMYAEEARQRWGHTDAYKQSVERTKKLTKADWARMSAKTDALLREIVAAMPLGPSSAEVRPLIGRHYDSLRAFYEPNLELYRGLATMYAADDRFAAFYRKYHPDLPEFMRDAMIAFCDTGGERA